MMDPLGDPLRDAFNPPPRYLLESDSEDEIGGGVYGEGRVSRKKTISREHDVKSDTPLTSDPNGHLIVSVGFAGAEFGSRVKTSGAGNIVKVDGVVAGTLYGLSDKAACMLIVSGRLPNSVLYPLSSWLLDSLRPSKLSILDVYPTPLYIQNGESKIAADPARYLQTAPSGSVPGAIERFAAPNLLSTQTIASTLICIAQQRGLPALLLLLPFHRILRPPPRILEEDADDEVVGEGDAWNVDVIVKAFGLTPDVMQASPAVRVSPRSARGSARRISGSDGMYI